MYEVQDVETGYMDTSICSIYDGNNFYIGFGPSFEYPKTVVERVKNGEEVGYMEDIFGNTSKGRKSGKIDRQYKAGKQYFLKVCILFAFRRYCDVSFCYDCTFGA